MSEREMTLQEWVERLPEIHAARREYDALRLRLADAEEELSQWRATGESALRNEHDLAARLAEAEALLRVMPGYGLSAYDKERWEKARNAFLASDSATVTTGEPK